MTHNKKKSIKLLPETVISQIAAGEVIERPAAIVRELLDNSLDAGASEIVITVTENDLFSLKIKDNGSGIAKKDLETAFQKHTTSKIQTFDDIYDIRSLGFRGEALASIASVACVNAVSSTTEDGEGAFISIDGGKITETKSVPSPRGTEITVNKIFYNMPVRKKFLKSRSYEIKEIREEIIRHILSSPRCGFKFIRTKPSGKNQKPITEIHIPAGWDLKERIKKLFAKDITDCLMPVNESNPDFRLTGYMTGAGYRGASRKNQFFFVKNRVIKNTTLDAALKNSYQNIIPSGKFPACFLILESRDGKKIDFNVHPAKKEVRFENSGDVYKFLFHSLRDCLYSGFKSYRTGNIPSETGLPRGEIQNHEKNDTSHEIKNDQNALANPTFFSTLGNKDAGPEESYGPEKTEESALHDHFSESTNFKSDSQKRPLNHTENPQHPEVHIIGQYRNSYIVFEINDELFICDQHALAERINYETLKKQMDEKKIEVQYLLSPMLFTPGKEAVEIILEEKKNLKNIGLLFEPFGEDTIKLDQIPSWIPSQKPHEIIKSLIETIMTEAVYKTKAKKSTFLTGFLTGAACRMSVMAGDSLHPQKMKNLILTFFTNDYPPTCPHGRPVIKSFTHAEIKKWFTRP